MVNIFWRLMFEATDPPNLTKGIDGGTFPSFSAGWRISEEDFIKNDWLSNLKLRASWGKLGNHRTDDYQYIALITLGEKYNFGNTVG